MSAVTLIAQESPYGSERLFNALRLAHALLARPDAGEVRLFLLGDAVYAAMQAQTRPEGSYCIEDMLDEAMRKGARVTACGTCIDHRGLYGLVLVKGIEVGTMSDLAEWVATSERVVSF